MSALPTSTWRARLKKIPGVAPLAKRLFAPTFEGAWLYRQEVVQWLYDPSLRRQLPLPFRTFATYCAAQRPLWDDVVGGATALRAAMSARRRLGLPGHARLEVGDDVVYVSLDDPRMLQVPNELASPEADTRVLHALLGPGDAFIDVGANHGSFSIVASRLVGPEGAVVAVEPQPRLAGLVERSLAENAPGTDRRVLPFALADEPGTLCLHVPPGSSGSATLLSDVPEAAGWEAYEVPVRRLDDVVDPASLPGRLVMKLDVEGAEVGVLRGGLGLLRARRPALLLEINPRRIADASGPEALLAVAREAGYDGYAEVDLSGAVLPLDDLDTGRHRNVVLFAS